MYMEDMKDRMTNCIPCDVYEAEMKQILIKWAACRWWCTRKIWYIEKTILLIWRQIHNQFETTTSLL